jgi:hypothetical protein
MLRVPVQVDNARLPEIEKQFGLSVATQNQLIATFTTGSGRRYKYPWGNSPDTRNAPILLKANQMGMGMNMAGLYFNGPDNVQDPTKNGLWMVTADGYRSGGAGNVGIFPPFDPVTQLNAAQENDMAGTRGVLAGERGVLAGERGVLASERGVLRSERGILASERGALVEEKNHLTPAGIGCGEELQPNEGYVMVRPLSAEAEKLYDVIANAPSSGGVTLAKKIGADSGIPLISFGHIGEEHAPVIMFGVVGHCLTCPNAASITTPLNGPAIAEATGIPVIEFPEFAHHAVEGSHPIVPPGIDMRTAGRRVYFPPRFAALTAA